MPEMNIIQAVNDALRLEMRRDPDVVVLGEDVGKFGGVFRATHGLHEEFGADRLFFILNSDHEPQWVRLPRLGADRAWHRAIDTSLASGDDFSEAGREVALDPADHYVVNPRSTVVLVAVGGTFHKDYTWLPAEDVTRAIRPASGHADR